MTITTFDGRRALPGTFPRNGIVKPLSGQDVLLAAVWLAAVWLAAVWPGRERRPLVIRLFVIVVATLIAAAPAFAADLKIATWNMEWLTLRHAGDPALPSDVEPKTSADLATLRAYATQLDADVVALQEVDGPAAAATVFPPERYRLFFTDDHVIQRVGIAVRSTIAAHRNPDLTALDVSSPNAAFHLRSGLDLTLDLPSGPLRILAVHLKTGCQFDPLRTSTRRQCATLRDQVPALQAWVAQRQREGVPFVILGDFNRWMTPADGLLAALDQAGPLTQITEGHDSPCWGGEHFIDHILAGGPARSWLDPASLRVLVYHEGVDRKEHLSDHCPVSAHFHTPG